MSDSTATDLLPFEDLTSHCTVYWLKVGIERKDLYMPDHILCHIPYFARLMESGDISPQKSFWIPECKPESLAKLFRYLAFGIPEDEIRSAQQADDYVKIYVEALKIDDGDPPTRLRYQILNKLVAFYATSTPDWSTITLFRNYPERGNDQLFELLLLEYAHRLSSALFIRPFHLLWAIDYLGSSNVLTMNEIIMVDSTASHDRYLCECEICRDLATRWDEEEERQVMKAREEKEAQGQLENEDEDEDEAEDEYDDEDEDENAYTMSKVGMELDGHTSDQRSFH
ncbi:hypothetical protein PMZ80_003157 [Knufia obscura]|uniref:BTB domain-containing protein n=1 Tax=Knufia obscura TaxID=1635080 RepID=A0ABR0RTE8_9EURO|nr:hypothetical protein PMZ80_003157 [Knufia obscura]